MSKNKKKREAKKAKRLEVIIGFEWVYFFHHSQQFPPFTAIPTIHNNPLHSQQFPPFTTISNIHNFLHSQQFPPFLIATILNNSRHSQQFPPFTTIPTIHNNSQ